MMPRDFAPDKVLAKLLANAEELYEPKKVETPNDWLVT